MRSKEKLALLLFILLSQNIISLTSWENKKTSTIKEVNNWGSYRIVGAQIDDLQMLTERVNISITIMDNDNKSLHIHVKYFD